MPWRVTGRIDPHGLTGLACPSGSLCVAVDGAGDVIASTSPSGGPSGWVAAPIDDGNQLLGISCPSVALCIAVDAAGQVVTSTNPVGGAGAWAVARVDGTNAVSSVSCPSVALCVAVDSAGNAVVSTDPAGGPSAWTVNHVDTNLYYECAHYGTPPCQPKLVGVSCPSVSLCVAADDAGFAISSTAPTTAGPWTGRGGPPGGDYVGVSCASESLCAGTCPLGVDLGGTGGCSGSPHASYGSTSVVTWNPSTAFQRYVTISPHTPGEVWCRSGPLCFAADASGSLLGSTDPASGASAWALVRSGPSMVTGVSCPSLSLCVAVDHAGYAIVGGPPRIFRFGPAGGGTRTTFTVQFTAPLSERGTDDFYAVDISGPQGCRDAHAYTTEDATAGQLVTLPVDPSVIVPFGSARQWCVGRYSGSVSYCYCGLTETTPDVPIGRFSFAVRGPANYSGMTSQRKSISLTLSATGTRITDITSAIVIRCRSGRRSTNRSYLVRRGSRNTITFPNATFTARWSLRIAGGTQYLKLTGRLANGTFQGKMRVQAAAGGMRCDSGPVTWSAG